MVACPALVVAASKGRWPSILISRGASLAKDQNLITINRNHNSVNGDTTSIAVLIATPGADGVSLPETLMAANNTAGEDTITLASNLANHDIHFPDPLNTINVVQLAITDDIIIQGPKETPRFSKAQPSLAISSLARDASWTLPPT